MGKWRLKGEPAFAKVVGLPGLCCDHPLTLLTTQWILNEDPRVSWTLPNSLSTYWLAAHKPLAEGRAGQQHWEVWQLEEMGCELVGQGGLVAKTSWHCNPFPQAGTPSLTPGGGSTHKTPNHTSKPQTQCPPYFPKVLLHMSPDPHFAEL